MTQRFEFIYWDLEFKRILPSECCAKLILVLKMAYHLQSRLLVALACFFDIQR
jgi:hypothetical protein